MDIRGISDLEMLSSMWAKAKLEERESIETRREIEDRIKEIIAIDETDESVKNIEAGRYSIKITCRIDRKVDVDLVQEIAAEHGLQDSLDVLFKWEARPNMKVWRDTDPAITLPISMAITAKPGRPTFTITEKSNG